MRKLIPLLALLLFAGSSVPAQQTVGVFRNDPGSYDGYTLFAPSSNTTTYLVDNCGRVVHTWTSLVPPGLSAYLLEDGSLLRTGRIASGSFSGGGSGGRVEIISWEDSLLWGFNYSGNDFHQHHDVEILPNGNVLLLAWESKTAAEAIAQGRNPGTVANQLWPEHIVEVRPILPDSGEIVWEWHVWDHLIQDYDSTQANYGVVANHPELIDLNFVNNQVGGNPGAQMDWMHCNSINYNPVFDQIVISSRNFNEFWVIDHSTTITDAAGHTGGNSGKGGDLLYRWGNPQTYGRGTAQDQVFFNQHDAEWVPQGYPGAGNITVFNNGVNRDGTNSWSTVDEVAPPVDSTGRYTIQAGQPFGPDSLAWRYEAPVPGDFYSRNVSGAQRLPNGNTLICEGASGNFFEVDSTGNEVWKYVCPVSITGPITQGNPAFGNSVFRAYRYGPNYPAFQGRDLTPGATIEINPIFPASCDSLVASLSQEENPGLSIYPNPFSAELHFSGADLAGSTFEIIDLMGTRLGEFRPNSAEFSISTADWKAGIYFLRIQEKGGRPIRLVKLTN